MARLLFIVARDRPDIYEYLRSHFADEEAVAVITDRRQPAARASGPAADTGARRERRARNIERDLESLGWALVRRMESL